MSREQTRSAPRSRGGSQGGMTLIELLVAMSISLVISTMIILSWVALSASYANTVRRSEMTDDARAALDRMQREIRDAEQPPESSSETAIVRARPYYVVVYTTFNKTGNAAPTTPPRTVMYRLYGNGELWRFHDADGDGAIAGVNMSLESPLGTPESGEGAQLLIEDIVNLTSPSAGSPTALFTYLYYGTDGGVVSNDHDVRTTASRSQIRAVEVNMLVDQNPGKSPEYWHVRSTAQLRNTR